MMAQAPSDVLVVELPSEAATLSLASTPPTALRGIGAVGCFDGTCALLRLTAGSRVLSECAYEVIPCVSNESLCAAGAARCARINAEATSAAFANARGAVTTVDVETCGSIRSWACGNVSCVHWLDSQHPRLLLTGTGDKGVLRALDLRAPRATGTIDARHTHEDAISELDSFGHEVFCCSADGCVAVYDVRHFARALYQQQQQAAKAKVQQRGGAVTASRTPLVKGSSRANALQKAWRAKQRKTPKQPDVVDLDYAPLDELLCMAVMRNTSASVSSPPAHFGIIAGGISGRLHRFDRHLGHGAAPQAALLPPPAPSSSASSASWGYSGSAPGHPLPVDAILALDEQTVLTGAADGFVRVVQVGGQRCKLLGIVEYAHALSKASQGQKGSHGDSASISDAEAQDGDGDVLYAQQVQVQFPPVDALSLSAGSAILGVVAYSCRLPLVDVAFLLESRDASQSSRDTRSRGQGHSDSSNPADENTRDQGSEHETTESSSDEDEGFFGGLT
ncbi:WD repeat-containing protein JIP5 [Porphyridium purpureum]|uniref:WD repeat-containing protein JIP5 n=1 Tax=Porphyridium purpureum TaxID=35688 RepID=A0A5J4YMY4_PORPP|nr:WD repeat-containing protein JIP5 [Porphyridium purpureum]|eukprot:POR3405..scf295_9